MPLIEGSFNQNLHLQRNSKIAEVELFLWEELWLSCLERWWEALAGLYCCCVRVQGLPDFAPEEGVSAQAERHPDVIKYAKVQRANRV